MEACARVGGGELGLLVQDCARALKHVHRTGIPLIPGGPNKGCVTGYGDGPAEVAHGAKDFEIEKSDPAALPNG